MNKPTTLEQRIDKSYNVVLEKCVISKEELMHLIIDVRLVELDLLEQAINRYWGDENFKVSIERFKMYRLEKLKEQL